MTSAAASGAERRAVQADLRRLGRLIDAVDAREAAELARTRLAVEALGVARLGDLQRHVDEHLDELVRIEQRAGGVALGPEGRDEGHDHDQAAVDHQLRDLRDAADVLVAVGGAEAEVAAQPVADVVAVEDRGVRTLGEQPLLHQVGDRRLARTGQPGQPDDAWMVPVRGRRGRLCRRRGDGGAGPELASLKCGYPRSGYLWLRPTLRGSSCEAEVWPRSSRRSCWSRRGRPQPQAAGTAAATAS